ncbi:MAG: nucleotidyltransferase [Gammaproteobacteria bacterium]|nr:nucleotidyltransferase [Gammaproteobacteria bacterium]
MAQASTYFYDSNDADRQTLHRRITPSDAQYDEQEARWNLLADFIKPKLAETSGYPIRSWLQGSYKFGTQVRPVHTGDEFDIDLGVYYCWSGSSNDGDFGPKELKTMVQDTLKEFEAENDDVVEVLEPPKMRCCRIRFRGGFHIDVPCYHLDEQRDARALAIEDDSWEDSDPKAIYKWFTSQFDDYTRSRVRRLVRYMKAWAALKFRDDQDRPSSVLLTVLVAQAVYGLDGGLPVPEDEALKVVLCKVYETAFVAQDVRNPVDPDENLASRMNAEQWSAFTDGLKQFSEVADQAVDAESEVSACTLWSASFEYLFPLPDAQTLSEEARQLPALRTLPEVQVKAVSKDNSNLRYNGKNEIGPIPKNCNISFRVSNADRMPYGTNFYWMVRNEGDEAEDINDLGHKAGQGIEATEHSAYNGTHYMDCTAVAGGRIIGVRRVRVRINSFVAPKRNPPKPAWTKIKGRR